MQKNLRREKNRKRRSSEGESSQGSESEQDHSSLPGTPEDNRPPPILGLGNRPKFFIETIPEDTLLEVITPGELKIPEGVERASFTSDGSGTTDQTLTSSDETLVRENSGQNLLLKNEGEEKVQQENSPDKNKQTTSRKKRGKKGKKKKNKEEKEKILQDPRFSNFVAAQQNDSENETGENGLKQVGKTISEDSAIGESEDTNSPPNENCLLEDTAPPHALDTTRNKKGYEALIKASENEEECQNHHADDEWGGEEGEENDEWQEVVSRKRKVWRKKRTGTISSSTDSNSRQSKGSSGDSASYTDLEWSTVDSGIDQSTP
jgi:hypothetical protein